MKSLRNLLAGAAVAAALAVTVAPHAAQATEAAPSGPASAPALAADGRLHAYYSTWYQNECQSWSVDANWSECKNNAESLWNMRYPGNLDDVWVYYNSNFSGAGRGVYNGAGLPNLKDWQFGSGGAGAGQALWHNIASHRFVNLP
ncbi:hypothetical protein [Streptomyces sp. CBMA156]|uniref:hypothetical protein n=1 Tax=Streptomyces sp. CBMA156 TaxID=1930280 RepID=UPI001661B0ED|nr:hypothetical protein [Streptomyces sp. CBMA156]MBD0669305.1 hypothetical protein [Streptomyces sp. CBMA156]